MNKKNSASNVTQSPIQLKKQYNRRSGGVELRGGGGKKVEKGWGGGGVGNIGGRLNHVP